MRKLSSHSLMIVSFVSIIILVIITAGLLSIHTLSASSKKLEDKINSITAYTSSENWNMAGNELVAMKNDWSGMESLWSVLLDHIEIDNIDTSLSRVSMFIESKDKPQVLAEAAVLKQYVKHIPDKEAFSMKNIF